jgi:hypothetical protein
MAFKGQDLIDGVYDNGVSYDSVLLYSRYLLVRFLSYLMFFIILSDPQNYNNLINHNYLKPRILTSQKILLKISSLILLT